MYSVNEARKSKGNKARSFKNIQYYNYIIAHVRNLSVRFSLFRKNIQINSKT